MPITVSKRATALQPSATFAIAQKASDLRAAGHDVISLSVGEPDFETPKSICDAAVKAIEAGHTHYTNVDGIPELKQAIVDKFARENNLQFNTDEIIVSVGAKHTLANICQALFNPGDEAIIPSPYWVSYPDMVRLAEGVPVFIDAGIEQHFKITPEQLKAALTDKTKMVMLNSPSNPSGAEYSAEELKALGAVMANHPNTLIVCDDIYEHLRWAPTPFKTLLNVCPELREQTVIVNGVSKAYAMTGWRIGYAAGPANLVKAMKKLQSQCTSNPCSIAQYAAVQALNGGLEPIKPMVEAFKERSKFFCNALNQIKGFKCLPTSATLYAFADVREAMQQHGCQTDIEFASLLLDQVQIAAVPGTSFGLPGYMRFSYATSNEILQQAIDRLLTIEVA